MDETKAQTEAFPPVTFEEFKCPTKEEWRAEAEAALKGAPFDKRMYTPTYEGITLEPIYTLDDSSDLLFGQSLPGEFPFLRGTKSAGYAAEPWKIAQMASEPLAEAANAAAKSELRKGAAAVIFELDARTRTGSPLPKETEPDDAGISVVSLEDADKLFDGLDLKAAPVMIYAGASALPMLALTAARYRACGERDALKEIRGTIGADPLGELAETGALQLPLQELYDEMAASVRWAEQNTPNLKTILIRGGVWNNGGANAVQETAYSVCAAVAYIRAMAARGIEPERTMAQIKFSFSLGKNFFMEIARLRAVRTVWAQVAEAFGAGDGECAKIDVFVRTSEFTMSKYDPYVNILRTTTQAFSGAVGGADAMQVGCFDEAVRPGGELSKRIARNIQIMLQTEFEMLQPVDPAGGSWYIERLTQQAADEIWKLVQQCDADGGLHAALKRGTVQSEIEKVRALRLKDLAFRKDRAVGTNMYPNVLEKPLDTEPRKSEKTSPERLENVCRFIENRDDAYLGERLIELSADLNAGAEKVVDICQEAFLSGALMSEVREMLNDGFCGGPETAAAIGRHRQTEQFEALRAATEEYAARTGKNIRIFLANMGPIPQHKARADFSAGFMEVAHFEVLRNDGFASPEDAVKAAVESGADAAVICSADDTYPELVPPVAAGIKQAAPQMKVFLAGAPAAEFKDSYTQAGVDDFIHVKANCLQILKSIQDSKDGFRNDQ